MLPFFYCDILLCNNSLFILTDVVLPTLRLACVVPDALVWWNLIESYDSPSIASRP